MSPLLEVDSVSVAFGALQAVDNVSFTVAEASIVGLIGPNGAGKTTTFNVVSGLQRASKGTVSFDGRELTHLPAHRRAALGIGRTFQNLGLVNDQTVETNLLAAQYLSAGYRGWDLMLRPWRCQHRETELRRHAVAAAATFGLRDQLDRRIGDLGFGAARFAELACVLVERPRLMLLDEPTTGLDVVEVQRLLDVLSQLRASGTTILVVAHDVRFVMDLCDYIYVLTEGRVLAEGCPADVRTDPRVVAAYLGRPA
jgi:branched-chain amino acid transport system ATP-binding protein